jgi:hypothetical protein
VSVQAISRGVKAEELPWMPGCPSCSLHRSPIPSKHLIRNGEQNPQTSANKKKHDNSPDL